MSTAGYISDACLRSGSYTGSAPRMYVSVFSRRRSQLGGALSLCRRSIVPMRIGKFVRVTAKYLSPMGDTPGAAQSMRAPVGLEARYHIQLMEWRCKKHSDSGTTVIYSTKHDSRIVM